MIIGLVLQYQLEEFVLAVAAAAIEPKTAVVNVLTLMTFTTHCRRLVWVGTGSMTGITGQAFVRAQQWVTSMFFVIKLPQIPRVGGMTSLAFIPQGTFVMIILLVATRAFGAGAGELIADVTILTRHYVV